MAGAAGVRAVRARSSQTMPRPGELSHARAELAGRLRARRGGLEEALLTRVFAIADPGEANHPGYLEGLRGALTAALEYALEAIEAGEERAPPIPIPLLAQARLAARSKVSLDTVLRRYFAGYTLLGELIVQESGELKLHDPALKHLLHAHSLAFDRLLAAVSEEHAREAGSSPVSGGRRRLHLVQRLLDGEAVEAAELRYPFAGHHLGLLCSGPGVEEAVRELASAIGRVVLDVRPEPRTIWVWLGGSRPFDAGELDRVAATKAPAGAAFAIGEPDEGLSGWRLTHRQAAAALPVALCGEAGVVRYVDVSLCAATMSDDVLLATFKRLYIDPLERLREGGRTARETLRAYFQAGRNVSSTAAMLDTSRNTIGSRLRSIEATLGRPLSACAAELELALDLERLGR